MNQPPGGGGGYPPQGGGHPPQGGGYPPQGGGYPPPQQGQYPGGSYLPPPGHMPGPHGVPPRSAIPKVIGILMIIFAGLGLLGTLSNLAGSSTLSTAGMRGEFKDAFESMNTFISITNVIGLGFGILHLAAGIQLVRYAKNGPSLAIAYAIASIIFTVISLILVYAWLMPALDGAPAGAKSLVGFGFIIGGLFSIAWPVIVWALVSRPQARAACNR